MALTKVSTPAIKDEAITLAKLLHGDSNSNGKFLRANNGADPTFETVNTDLVSDTSPQLGGDLASNGNDILLADSDKAVFGTGADLKIYHNGSHNYFLSSNGDYVFDTGSTELARLTTTGRLGIGTSSPQQRLHLHTASSSAANMVFSNTTTGSGASDGFVVGLDGAERGQIFNQENTDLIFGTNNLERMRIDSSGNVGIGTTTPESKLAIKGTSGEQDLFSISDTTVPTSGGEYGVAMIKTNTSNRALNITNYNVAGIGVRIYNNGGAAGRNALECYQAGGTRFIVNEDVTVSTGNLVIGTSGKGINFSATSDASGMSSETLDDYEEGTWTPTYNTGSASSAMFDSCTYNNTAGYYTKIGNRVMFEFRIQISNIVNANSGSHVIITGLPFTSVGGTGSQGGAEFNYSQAVCSSNNGYLPTMHIGSNNTNISFFTCNGNVYTVGDGNNNFTHTLHVHGQYTTAS